MLGTEASGKYNHVITRDNKWPMPLLQNAALKFDAEECGFRVPRPSLVKCLHIHIPFSYVLRQGKAT